MCRSHPFGDAISSPVCGGLASVWRHHFAVGELVSEDEGSGSVRGANVFLDTLFVGL
jgi:hypothetical protein